MKLHWIQNVQILDGKTSSLNCNHIFKINIANEAKYSLQDFNTNVLFLTIFASLFKMHRYHTPYDETREKSEMKLSPE